MDWLYGRDLHHERVNACMHSAKYFLWLWQNNRHLCIQIFKKDALIWSSSSRSLYRLWHFKLIFYRCNLLRLTLISCHVCTFCQSVIYAHFVSKENLFVLFSLLNDWNYFWNEYCNLLFLAICAPNFPFWYFLHHPDNKKRKLRCECACEIIEQPVIKQSPAYQFLYFSLSHWLLYECFFCLF